MDAGNQVRRFLACQKQNRLTEQEKTMPTPSKKAIQLAAIIFVACFCASFARAGTIAFKDGTVLSDAEIVSISEDSIVIMKDKTKRSFPLKSLKSYSQTDLSSKIASEEFPDEFCDYSVSILDVKMPKSGENKDGQTEQCEMSYSISKHPDKAKKLKMPYFYLYVLTGRDNEAENRKIYRFCYPDQAKPKGSNYDLAATMEKVSGFDRPIWGEEDQAFMHRQELGGKKVKFDLKKIGERRILAYRIEVWGSKDIVAEKSETVQHLGLEQIKVASKWWERY